MTSPHAELMAFAAQHPLGVLATVGAGGEPEAALVGVVAMPDGTLLVDAAVDARKVQNIRHEPRVAVVLGTGDVTMQVEGLARIAEGPEREVLGAAYESASPGSRALDPRFAVIAIMPRWVRTYDASQRPARITESRF